MDLYSAILPKVHNLLTHSCNRLPSHRSCSNSHGFKTLRFSMTTSYPLSPAFRPESGREDRGVRDEAKRQANIVPMADTALCRPILIHLHREEDSQHQECGTLEADNSQGIWGAVVVKWMSNADSQVSFLFYSASSCCWNSVTPLVTLSTRRGAAFCGRGTITSWISSKSQAHLGGCGLWLKGCLSHRHSQPIRFVICMNWNLMPINLSPLSNYKTL